MRLVKHALNTPLNGGRRVMQAIRMAREARSSSNGRKAGSLVSVDNAVRLILADHTAVRPPSTNRLTPLI